MSILYNLIITKVLCNIFDRYKHGHKHSNLNELSLKMTKHGDYVVKHSIASSFLFLFFFFFNYRVVQVQRYFNFLMLREIKIKSGVAHNVLK